MPAKQKQANEKEEEEEREEEQFEGEQVMEAVLVCGLDAVRGRLCGRWCSRIRSVMQEEREAQEGW